MGILEKLGLGAGRPRIEAPDERGERPADGETETVRRIVDELDALPVERARWLAAFAYLLGRVAHADLDISTAEREAMVALVEEHGGLPEAQAVLVVEIARRQNELFGHTENFLVAREFREIASREERVGLLECLAAVAAADETVSSDEERQIRQIANELGLDHEDFTAALATVAEYRSVLRGLGGGEGA